jgi:hypothetical protein
VTPETQLKNDVVKYLKAAGLFFFRMNSGKVKVRNGWMVLCPKGTGDFLIFRGPLIFWAELKAAGQATSKEVSQKQQEFRERVLSEGHHHARCESVEDVKKLLET